MKIRREEGFTLVELLIVIGVIGILAAGLFAAIDPIEQLRKGNDTNQRSAVVEYHNANTRYYATHGDLPWDDNAACVVDFTGGPITLTGMSGCTDVLIADGELKEDFALGVQDTDSIFVYSAVAGDMSVCFSPESRAQFNDDATAFDNQGTDISGPGGLCADKSALTPGTSCFWCAK